MRFCLILLLGAVLLCCCGCNTIYQIAFFRHLFGKDEDDVDTIPFVGAWVDGEHMSGSRTAACAAIGTKIYVCGGEDSTGALDRVEIYDTEADTWETVSPLTAPATGHVCAACNDKVYVFGGSATSSVYYPASDQWSSIAAPQQTFHASAAVYNGKTYYFGGAFASGYTCSSTQIYDPLLDSWSEKLNAFRQSSPILMAGFLAALASFANNYRQDISYIRFKHMDYPDPYGIDGIYSFIGEYMVLCFTDPYQIHEMVDFKIKWIYSKVLSPYEGQILCQLVQWIIPFHENSIVQAVWVFHVLRNYVHDLEAASLEEINLTIERLAIGTRTEDILLDRHVTVLSVTRYPCT